MTAIMLNEVPAGNKKDLAIDGRGRNAGYPAPPAQIPACATNAPGSSFGFWRQSGLKEFLDSLVSVAGPLDFPA